MREFAAELFGNYAFVILFLHVLGAIVWVGGMIAMRIAVHPALQHIEEAKVRLARTLEMVGNLFRLVLPFIVLLLLTGLIMGLAVGSGGTKSGMFVHMKEGIWLIMTLNYAMMVRLRNRAERFFISGDHAGARKTMEPVAKIMLPLKTRAQILRARGIEFRQVGCRFDEDSLDVSVPKDFVYHAAMGKMRACEAEHGLSVPILCADTVVTARGKILRKASSLEEAREILKMQSGGTVAILTCMVYRTEELMFVDLSGTFYDATFRVESGEAKREPAWWRGFANHT